MNCTQKQMLRLFMMAGLLIPCQQVQTDGNELIDNAQFVLNIHSSLDIAKSLQQIVTDDNKIANAAKAA